MGLMLHSMNGQTPFSSRLTAILDEYIGLCVFFEQLREDKEDPHPPGWAVEEAWALSLIPRATFIELTWLIPVVMPSIPHDEPASLATSITTKA